MEQKQSKKPEEQGSEKQVLEENSKKVELLNKRRQMKSFHKARQIESFQIQRVKRQSLNKLPFVSTEEEIKSLIQLMRSQRSTLKILQKIQIDELMSPATASAFLSQIRNNFCRLRQLKFRVKGIDEEVLFKVVGNNHKQLQQLSLRFRFCHKLASERVKAFAAQMGKHSRNLLEFNLEFSRCSETTDEGALVLLKQIGKTLKNLERMSLSFEHCPITDKTVQALAGQFQSLKKLRHLSLNFARLGGLTEQGVLILSSHLRSDLPQLHQLNLDFYDSGINDQAVEILATQLGKMQTLLGLTLRFDLCFNLTDTSTQSLARLFRKKLRKLQHLNISLQWCLAIGNTGVKILANSIGYLPNLQHFSFAAWGFACMDKAYMNLVNLNFNKLSHLNLSFSTPDNQLARIVEALAKNLGNNPHRLQEFELHFQSSSNFTDKAVLALGDQLCNNPGQLRKIKLMFSSSVSQSGEMKEVLKNHIANWRRRLDCFDLNI